MSKRKHRHVRLQPKGQRSPKPCSIVAFISQKGLVYNGVVYSNHEIQDETSSRYWCDIVHWARLQKAKIVKVAGGNFYIDSLVA